MLAYGFVLDPNPDDTVGLRLGTTHILGPMQTRLREKGLDAGKRFELGKDGVVDEGLVEVMRVMMAHTAEEEEEEGIDEDAERERRDRNVERDLEVLGALGQMMEDKLVKLQSAPEEGVGEVREEVRRICEVYRRGPFTLLVGLRGR